MVTQAHALPAGPCDPRAARSSPLPSPPSFPPAAATSHEAVAIHPLQHQAFFCRFPPQNLPTHTSPLTATLKKKKTPQPHSAPSRARLNAVPILPRALPAQHRWAFQENNDSFPLQLNNKQQQRRPRCLPCAQRAAPARSTRPWGGQEQRERAPTPLSNQAPKLLFGVICLRHSGVSPPRARGLEEEGQGEGGGSCNQGQLQADSPGSSLPSSP